MAGTQGNILAASVTASNPPLLSFDQPRS